VRKVDEKKTERLIGYARVSTLEQNLDMQIQELKKAGVHPDAIHVEKLSASNKKRPKLDWALSVMRTGDVLVVYKLDRIARSLRELLERLEQIRQTGGGIRSITEQVDTSTPGGTLLLHVLGALAQFERDLVRQRTISGVAAAKARGVKFGQPKKLNREQVAQCKAWRKDGKTVREIVDLVERKYGIEVSQQTIWVRTKGKR